MIFLGWIGGIIVGLVLVVGARGGRGGSGRGECGRLETGGYVAETTHGDEGGETLQEPQFDTRVLSRQSWLSCVVVV